MSEVESQKMNFLLILDGAELYSGDHSNAKALASLARRGNALDRVVIRERQCGETAPFGCLDYTVGADGPVRGGRMGMQVDERRPARIRAHCS
jgi:hypothetical protein